MDTLAAVMTGKGVGAISSIQLIGAGATEIIEKIFKPAGNKPLRLERDKILLGDIINGDELIDRVVIGCEGENNFAINCHGNPLIVEMIMQLLQQNGARPVGSEQMLKEIFTAQGQGNSIALEAKLAQIKACTLEGTKIIANQADAGLTKTARHWLEDIDSISLTAICKETEAILKRSQTAKLIIYGCKVVLAGPANSGKSTLLNCLCGRQKSIVTDIAGTTRDWVGACCRFEWLFMELFDTAGLGATQGDSVDKAARQKTAELLADADLVMLVLDSSETNEQLDELLLEKVAGKRVLTVLNKSDLPAKFDESRLPQSLAETVKISALLGDGIDNLIEKIPKMLGIVGFDLSAPVCITCRQENLLSKLVAAKSKAAATSLIRELLNGEIRV